MSMYRRYICMGDRPVTGYIFAEWDEGWMYNRLVPRLPGLC